MKASPCSDSAEFPEVWLEMQNASLWVVVEAAITASSSRPEFMPISING